MNHTLLIGYGNTLRGDDGAGICAAERASGRFPGVDILTVHELQPELAETMSRYADVIFLDAAVEGSGIRVVTLEPAADSRPDGSHAHSPATLLSLCHSLYGRVPGRSLLIAIPGRTFEFGENLSPFTEEMVEQAIEEIGHSIRS
ncbi:hydrogenase maturation protease [bacterium]|nr:MAG: hydrogenase maturation protease [bacterium]